MGDDTTWGVTVLVAAACVGVCLVAVIAGLIACARTAVAHWLKGRRRVGSRAWQRKRAKNIRRDIDAIHQRLDGFTAALKADAEARQRTTAEAFDELVATQLGDVEDVAHRFYEEAS